MAKKMVVIINILSFAGLLHGMEQLPDKKTGEIRFKLPLNKSADKLSKNDSEKFLSAKNGKRSIRSLSDVSHLRSEYRDKTMSPNRKSESSEKK